MTIKLTSFYEYYRCSCGRVSGPPQNTFAALRACPNCGHCGRGRHGVRALFWRFPFTFFYQEA